MTDSRWKTTACPHDCPDGCAIRARLQDGKIQMEPQKVLPWSTFICGKGLRWRERVFSPSRILKPLLRQESGWREISWEIAWSLWAEKMTRALEKSGPLSLMFYQSAGSLFFSKQLLPHLFASLGGMTSLRGNLCSSAGSHGLKETFEEMTVQLPETARDHANGVLLWGRNVWECHSHFIPILRDIKKRGGSLASLEIRPTETTRHSDRNWTIRPGTDAFLAAWLCRRLLEMGKAATGWENRMTCPEPFLNFLREMDEERVLAPTGLSLDQGEEIMEWILAHRPVTHCPGFGIQRYLHGDLPFRWIGVLAVMLGAFDEPGAGLSFSKDEMARFPSRLAPSPRQTRRLPVSAWHHKLDSLDPPIEVLVLSGANPLRQAPDTGGLEQAFRKIPFKVCLDLFMTETAAASDLVLPVASFMEEKGDWRGSYWHNYLIRTHKILSPQGLALPETAIFTGVASRLGLSLDLEDLARRMDRILLKAPAIEEIAEGVYRWDEPEFWQAPKSRCIPPLTLPPVTSGHKGCLRLVSVHSGTFINGQSDDAPRDGTTNWAALQPAEAIKLGLREGDLVVLKAANEHSLVRRLKLDENIAPQCCVIRQGLPGVNRLTPAHVSPGSGAPFHETWVHIFPASRKD